MKIEIHETVSQQPNGDRDTRRHPSSAFKVVLINGDKKSTLFSNDQFDSFHCHISGTRQGHLNEAQKKALEIGETMGCEVNIIPTTAPTEIDMLEKAYRCGPEAFEGTQGCAWGGLTVQWPVRQPSERPQRRSAGGLGNGSLAGRGSERASEGLGI